VQQYGERNESSEGGRAAILHPSHTSSADIVRDKLLGMRSRRHRGKVWRGDGQAAMRVRSHGEMERAK
jgi:hypothetical protein